MEELQKELTDIYKKAITEITTDCTADIDIGRFSSEMEMFNQKVSEISDDQDRNALYTSCDDGLSELMIFVIGHLGSHPTTFESIEGCTKKEKEWKTLIDISKEICKYSHSEKSKGWVLENIVRFCDEQFVTELKYKDFFKGEDGNISSETKKYEVTAELTEYITTARKNFAQEYNNLPTKAQKTKELNDLLEKKNAEIEETENALKLLKSNKIPEKLAVENDFASVTDFQERKKLVQNGKKPIANSFNWWMTFIFMVPAILDALVFGVMKLIALIGKLITKKEMISMVKPTNITFILMIALAVAGIIGIVIFWIFRVKNNKTKDKIVTVDGQEKYISYVDNEEYLENEAKIKETKKTLSEQEKERSKIKNQISDHEKTLL